MKKSIVISLVAAALFGSCVNQPHPLLVSKFYPLPATCDITTFQDDLFSPNAFLDVAWGRPTFVVAFALTNGDRVNQSEVSVGNQVLETANRNRPIIQQIVLNYRLSRRLGAQPPEFAINYTAVVEDEAFGQVQLISPELAEALDGLSPANDFSDTVDVLVDVEFIGEFSGSKTPFSTGVLTYPIRAYKSAPPAGVSCTNGFQRFETDSATGAVSCLYRGQSFSQNTQPPGPSSTTQCCPAVGSPGC